MNEKKNFIKSIQLWITIIIVMIGGSIIVLDIISSSQDFNFRADQMRSDYISRQKQTIKQEVIQVADRIRHEKAQSELLTKNKIKSRVYEACAIAQHIYQQNQAIESKSKIQQMILNALRPIRFENKNGYYFAVSMDGVGQLYPVQPELEGKNLIGLQDVKGNFIIQDEINVIKKSGEGFVTDFWPKPGKDPSAAYKKISFVKYFKPLDWYFGAGLYVDDVESRIKADLLSDISRIRFGKEGYIFVNRLNGDALVSNGKLVIGTKKLWEVFNNHPEKIKNIFKKEHNAALKPGGDYIYYYLIKLTNPTKQSPKVSFIYGIPEFKWLVGAGVYLDDVETVIARMQAELTKQIKTKMLYSFLVTLSIVVFSLLLFNWLNRKLKKDFNLFISFFNRAALSDEEIDRDRIQFYELDRMAENANKMLADRKQAEKAFINAAKDWQITFNSTNDAIWIQDQESYILRCNGMTEKILQQPADKIIGKHCWEVVHGTSQPIPGCPFQRSQNSLQREMIELQIGKRWFQVTTDPILNETGGFTGAVHCIRDITEHKQMENMLRASEMQYRLLADNISDVIWTMDMEQQLTYFSPSILKFRGYTPEEALQISVENSLTPESYERAVFALMEEIACEGKPGVSPDRSITLEIEHIRKDGTTVWGELTTSFIRDEDGSPTGIIGITRDIDERKRAEKTLRENEQLIISVFESIQDGISVLEPDLTIRLVNKVMNQWYSQNLPLKGKKCYECYRNADKPCEPCPSIRCLKSGKTEWNVMPGLPGSSTEWIELFSYPIKDPDSNEITGVVEFVRDITMRKRAEEKLKESEQKYRLLAYNITDTIWVLDIDTLQFFYVSPSVSGITGYSAEETTGLYLKDILTPASMDLATKAINKQLIVDNSGMAKPLTLELEHYRKDGSTVWAEVTTRFIRNKEGRPTKIMCVTRDITERRALEAQLRQARKMESIGTLSGGIAHDFNNILSIMIGNTELALDKVPESNSVHTNLEEIKTAGLRAKNIISQLLSFSRKTEQNLKAVAIVPVIKDAIQFLRSTIPTSIAIHADIIDSGETVLADPVGLNQIIMNLCINASHAMEQAGGILTVNVKSVILENTSDKNEPDLAPGDYVTIIVSDTGQGINHKIIDRIFDPYFTTKDVGKGSGMGLAIVHGIVKNYNGSISVESEPGKGTVFSILLPKITGQPEIKTEPTMDFPTGTETILFVDDEESIMKLGPLMLEPLGYKVDATMSPANALKRFSSNPDNYDLVITDMTMPEMTGVALAEELLRIRPDIPIIICTGHSPLIDEKKAKTIGIAAFVMKPLTIQKIAKIIRQVLKKRPAHSSKSK